MGEPDFLTLLGSAKVGPPADDRAIKVLGAAVGAALPQSYVDMLRAADGAEGWIGENYIRIFSTERIIEDPFPFREFIPGLLFFGTDGGAGLFAFDVREGSDRVLVVHTDDLEPSNVVELSPSLSDFLQLLNESDWIDVWTERRRDAEAAPPKT